MLKHTVHSITFLPRAILLLGSVAFMLSSCSKVTVAGQHGQDSSAITFTDVAAKSVVTGPSDIGSFSVWGWRTDNSSATPTPAEVFSATEVSRTGTSWTYEGTRYWMPENTYDFYALYPDTATLTTPDQSGIRAAESAAYDAAGNLTITNFDSTSGHDLMTASRTGMSGSNPQPVALPFSHELVRLSFKVRADDITVVAAILYDINIKGDFTRNFADGLGQQPVWTGFVKASVDDTPFSLGSAPVFSDGTAVLFEDILLPPHTGTDALADVRLAVTYRLADAQEPAQDETVTFRLSDASVTEWTAGSSYSYTATIAADLNLTVSVEDWTDGGDHPVSW